jgi:hypothetical protein
MGQSGAAETVARSGKAAHEAVGRMTGAGGYLNKCGAVRVSMLLSGGSGSSVGLLLAAHGRRGGRYAPIAAWSPAIGLKRARRLRFWGGGKKELVSCAVWTPQAQASEPKNSFEVSEQHLNLFPKTTCGLVFGRLGESASFVPGVLVNVPWDLAGLRAGAAMRLELAHVAFQFGGAVKSHAIGADAAPRGRVDSAVLHQGIVTAAPAC